jgi:nucleoside diphosphate kinase
MAIKHICPESMAAERSFIAIKPDGVQRGLVGEILGRFERKGFKLVGLKQLTPSRELAESHYGVHRERPFFAGLVDFITSGPVVAMVWEGDGVIASARKLIGVRYRQALEEFRMELSPGAGIVDNDAVQSFLNTRCLSIAGGTEQILLTMAGERLLGLPR